MQEPGVIRTRLWTERGLLPFIRSTICPESNSNVKREMGILGGPLQKRIVTHGGVPLPLFFSNCLKFPANDEPVTAAKSPAPERRSAIYQLPEGSKRGTLGLQ